MRQRQVEIIEDFDTDDFFANDFLTADHPDEEVGADLELAHGLYLTGPAKLKRSARRLLGIDR